MNDLKSIYLEKVIEAPRSVKRVVVASIDSLLLMFSMWGALAVSRNGISFSVTGDLASLYLVSLAIAIPLFANFGLYHVVHRHAGARFFAISGIAVSLYGGVFGGISEFILKHGFAWSFYIQHWILCLGTVSGGRWLACKTFKWLLDRSDEKNRVIIYGAGSAGAELATTLMKVRSYVPLAFIDDSPDLCGNHILGLKIYPPHRLKDLVDRYGVQEVFIAIPSVSRRRMREVVEYVGQFSVKIKTVPPLLDILSGGLPISDVREVDVEDLLGREPVPPNEMLMKKCVRGKSVLITGAGGSIGSELASQIALLECSTLILYEVSEAALYQVENRVRNLCHKNGKSCHGMEIIPVLGSALDERGMKNVIKAFGVESIYHTAAYKHVPMVEMNPINGVYNNLFGTWHAVQAALDTDVETFIFISTDKAVRPTSVMGASKRLAELVIQGVAELAGSPQFSIVRFGNVLGSSGSIVPLLKEQIRQGGPVTVTHPEVVRYFMSLIEAAQLVIQAGALGENGDVFVLDMGEPVKIIDLAKRMINLSGLTIRDENNSEGDIEIVITGLRPGEKLYEELLISEDNIEPTEHPKIMRVHEESMLWQQLIELLLDIEKCCVSGDVATLRNLLLSSVSGYVPQCNIRDPVWMALNSNKSYISSQRELRFENAPTSSSASKEYA